MTLTDALEQIPFLRAIPSLDRARLTTYAQLRVLARGESSWTDGAATGEFMFLVRGRVKLVKSSAAGRETIVDLRWPGGLLCASAVCAFSPYCCRAVAMEDDTEVLIVPRRDLFELLERSPAATSAFMREMTSCTLGLCTRIEEVASGRIEQRIAMLLARLCEQVGVPRPGEGTWIPVALSRQELADLCGTSLETAIRVMSRLGRDQIVRTLSRGFLVIDRAALTELAHPRPADG